MVERKALAIVGICIFLVEAYRLGKSRKGLVKILQFVEGHAHEVVGFGVFGMVLYLRIKVPHRFPIPASAIRRTAQFIV